MENSNDLSSALSKKFKIIIADDHPVYRKGVVSTLRQVPFIKQIAQAANGEEVLELLSQDSYDLVLMDIRMFPMDGIQATENIRLKFPTVKIIALTSYDDESLVLSMMNKGASGFLLKNTDRDEIIRALLKVLSGHTYYSEEIQSILHKKLDAMIYHPAPNPDTLLQPILKEVIFLLYHELTNKEIADVLNKSIRTIEAYRREILKKTDSTNLAGIIKYAGKMNIMDDVQLKIKFREILREKKKES